jgi:hypothetical protein
MAQTGSKSPAVSNAQAALNQAKAADDQAHSAVQQAQANVDLIEHSAYQADGVCADEWSDPDPQCRTGRICPTGSDALTMADISHLTITVYVPEDLYGKISWGWQPP